MFRPESHGPLRIALRPCELACRDRLLSRRVPTAQVLPTTDAGNRPLEEVFVDLSSHGCKQCGQRPLFPAAPDQAADVPCFECLGRIQRSLLRHIEEIDAVAHHLYVGRSNFPERRLLEHFSSPDKIRRGETWASDVLPNRLSVLHWSASWREIAALEVALIADFQRRGKLKLLNVDAESWGRWDGAWNCLYVLWAGKRSVKAASLPPAVAVDHLHWALVQPDVGQWQAAPLHLVVGAPLASVEAARNEGLALALRRELFLNSLKQNRVTRARRSRARVVDSK